MTVILVGGVLGMVGAPLPAAELGVAVSVVILGALLAIGTRAPLEVALVALVGCVFVLRALAPATAVASQFR